MPISNSYPSGIPIADADLFVGTKAYNNRTVNYTAQGVADYLNINSKVAIGGQMSFQFTIVPNIPKTIAFEGGLGNNTAFSAITKLIVSAMDLSTANITIFLNYLNNSQVLLSEQNQPNFFGHYKIIGYTQIGTSAFYELDLEFIGGNGTIIDKQYYDLVSFVLSTEVPPPTWGSITGDIEDQTDLIDYISSELIPYFLIPTGTTLEYVRGDGSLATFPTISVGDLQSVTDEGNTTTNNIQLIDAAELIFGAGGGILLDNASRLREGTIDAGLGGSKGIAQICGVGYELKWEAGRLYVMNGNGNAIRSSLYNFNIVPTINDDDTKAYYVGSLWSLDNGDVYECTDSTTGAAVWELINIGTIPTLQQVLDNNHDLVDGNFFAGTNAGISNSGNGVIALGEYAGYENTADNVNALGNSAGSGSEGENINAFGFFAGGFNTGNNVNALGYDAGFTNAFNNVNLFGQYAAADEDGQTVLSKDGAIMARISTTDLTDTRKYTLQDADGTLAFTSDIPSYTTPTLQQVTDEGAETTQYISVKDGENRTTLQQNGINFSDLDDGGNTILRFENTSTVDQEVLVRGLGGTMALLSDITGGGGSGGGASVSFYLNGSVSQGTIGGIAFREMDRTPILGAGTDFTINANGYIQSFITDTNVPNQLEIPAGNWNFETYFSASSGGGSPSFYIELYKWNGTTLSLIASNSATPRLITDGTNIEAYFSALAVPQTTLLATDRLAIRIYVTHSGRTITLHTENGNLCEVLTTFTTGLTALNGLTDQVQFFNVGTGATNFNISSSGDTHTFNLLFNIRRNANNSSNNNINYNGYAVTGSAESSAVWTITRLTIAASGSITVATATNVAWTNRESATYI